MTDKGDQPTKAVRLDGDTDWMTFAIGDHEFDVEIFEASDLLAENDRHHLRDPDGCLDCGHEFVREGDARKIREIVCPSCGSENVLPCQKFLDGVAKMIVERWGAKRCSRTEASAFYNAIVDACEAKKKKSETPPESHSSTTASTQEDGVEPPVEAG